MGMNLDHGGAKVRPEMNVTPLVDIVLVLLIIFMVLAPVMSKTMTVRLPPPPDETQQKLDQAAPPDQPLVLHVDEQGVFSVNKSVTLGPDELAERLHRMLNARPNNTVYLDAEDEAPYGAVLQAVDLARLGSASPIVAITEKL